MSQPAAAFPKRADYIPMVKAFLPTAEGLQLDLRCSLLLMRDGAVARKPIACEESWSILDIVERVATREAFRPMSNDELATLRWLLSNLVRTASNFDGLYAPSLPMEGVGADG